MKKIKDKLITIYPQLIFLIVTFCIFMPASLFLGNLDEFAVGFTALIPLLSIVNYGSSCYTDRSDCAKEDM